MPVRRQGDELVVPSGTTYSDLIDLLAAEMKARKLDETTPLGALAFMARRTAGRIVRNAATIAGNTMLVLEHIAAGTGEPFPSDLFTALVAVDARLTYLVLGAAGQFEPHTATAGRSRRRRRERPRRSTDRIVITAYVLPLGGARMPCSRRRSRSATSTRTASSTRRHASRFAGKLAVKAATLVFGGIAPYPWRARKTEAAMAGKTLTLEQAGALSTDPRAGSRRRTGSLGDADGGGSGRGLHQRVPHAARRVVPLQGDRQRAGARGRRGAARREVERRDHVGPLAGERRHAAATSHRRSRRRSRSPTSRSPRCIRRRASSTTRTSSRRRR